MSGKPKREPRQGLKVSPIISHTPPEVRATDRARIVDREGGVTGQQNSLSVLDLSETIPEEEQQRGKHISVSAEIHNFDEILPFPAESSNIAFPSPEIIVVPYESLGPVITEIEDVEGEIIGKSKPFERQSLPRYPHEGGADDILHRRMYV